MKIKVKPEDFIVNESADLQIDSKGKFGVYILKKKGWNTVDILKKLSKELKIPFSNFSYGGKKDKHAITSQFITIQHNNPIIYETENCSLKFIGFTNEAMRPNIIKGNDFEITIRDLTDTEIESALKNIDEVKKGYPNYFDDQRFGSYDLTQGFIAEKLLKKHFNGALKIYFTHINSDDNKEDKERKRFFFENWGNWELCLKRAKSKFEVSSFNYLTKNKKGFLPILQKIPSEEMSLFFSAYQSYIWNELLRRLISTLSPNNLLVYKGIAGDYFFYDKIENEKYNYLRGLSIPTADSKIKMPDDLTEKIYMEILNLHNIRPALFNMRKIRQAFFKGTERKALVIPENLSINYTDDELYNNKKRLTLKFFLPRGSYGSMLVKRIIIPSCNKNCHFI